MYYMYYIPCGISVAYFEYVSMTWYIVIILLSLIVMSNLSKGIITVPLIFIQPPIQKIKILVYHLISESDVY